MLTNFWFAVFMTAINLYLAIGQWGTVATWLIRAHLLIVALSYWAAWYVQARKEPTREPGR